MSRLRPLSLLIVAGMAVAAPGPATEPRVLGAGVSLAEATPIHEILADPDAWVGRTVRIEGGVLDVCPMKGCWVEVAGQEGSLRVKVEDDVIVFPADAEGKLIAAQGIVEAVDLTRDAYIAWLRHLAEEKGESADQVEDGVGAGPFRMIRLRGTGAQLE